MKNLGLAMVGVFLLCSSARGEDSRRVLVIPFENVTAVKSHVTVEEDNVSEEGQSGSSGSYQEPYGRKVDRYSHAPKSILEDIIVNTSGVSVVERQRVAALFEHGIDLPVEEGIYDTTTLIKPGYLQGVDALVFGTVESIDSETRKFYGHNINTENQTASAKVRVRVVDVESGRVIASRRVHGERTYRKSQFLGIEHQDVAFSVMELALAELQDDEVFVAALQGRELAIGAAAPGLTTVQFRPTPDKTEILIDGEYFGSSPATIDLPTGEPVRVTLRKGGYESWEATLRPRRGRVVDPELMVLSSDR